MTQNPTLARMVEAIDEISEDTACRMIIAAFEPMTDAEIATAFGRAEVESPVADLILIAARARDIDL